MSQLPRNLPPQIHPGEKLACLIYDSMLYDAQATASQLRIPSLVLRICSATFSLVPTQLPELISRGRVPNPDLDGPGAGDEIVPEFRPLRWNDLQILRNPDRAEALELYHRMSNITTTNAIIFDTVDCLEPFSIQQIAPGPFHKLAPLGGAGNSNLWKEDTGCLKWLDRQTPHSVVYVSIGSAVVIDANEFVETAHALADCGQPFLWVVRPGSVRGGGVSEEHLPEKLRKLVAEERGCVVGWCPQIRVLSHAAVGGFMMASEEEEGKGMRERAAHLRSKVEIAIGEGGSSSMAVHALVDFISSLPSPNY